MTDFVFGLEPLTPDPPEPTPVLDYEYTEADFLGQLLALLPPGDAWPREVGTLLHKFYEGIAPEFARAQDRARQLLLEFDARTAVEMLDEHEFVNGLPDPCATPPSTTEGRQAALVARLRDDAGHNPADYVAVCEAFGHAGTTVHRRPYPPFRAGIGRAGQRLYNDQWAHVFIVAYMTNALASGGWFDDDASTTSTTEIAPDGDADALEITFGATGYVYKNIFPLSPLSGQFAVWLRVPSGTASVTLGLYRLTSTLVAEETFEVDAVWRRYVMRGEGASALTTARLTASSAVVHVWGDCVGVVDDVVECRFQTISQAHTLPEFWTIGEYVEELE